jgi:MgtE intracellular N domain
VSVVIVDRVAPCSLVENGRRGLEAERDTSAICAADDVGSNPGSGLQLAGSAAHLKELSRDKQAQLVASAPASPAAEALSQLDADHREALLAALDKPDRERLRACCNGMSVDRARSGWPAFWTVRRHTIAVIMLAPHTTVTTVCRARIRSD